MDRLRDRVCLITGSTGIAAAIARRLATESRYPADRYALDVRFDVEAPGPAPARTGG